MRDVKAVGFEPNDGPEGSDVIRYGPEFEGQKADAQDERFPEVPQMDIDDSKAPISIEEADRIHDEIWADGPATQKDAEDHKRIASFGASKDARDTWDAQDGRLPEVLQMDIDDSKAPISMEEADRIHDEIWADVICRPLEVEQSFIGGRYGDIPHEDGKNVHHMPAKSALKDIGMADGPAIQMDEPDHKRTASFGASKDAQIYRDIQRQKIQEGHFLEALKMDIDDIQGKFGSKYDQALKNMLDYVKEREPKLSKELDDLKNHLGEDFI